MLVLLVMGEDAADGKIRLKRNEHQDKWELDIQWENDRSMPVFREIQSVVSEMARKLRGTEFYNPLWSLADRLITVHPLGGCLMADDYTGGVVQMFLL